MPFYTYECKECKERTEELRSFSKADNCPPCPKCTKETKRVFNPGEDLSVTYVGWGWGDKNRKFGEQRTKRSEEMKRIQKSYYGNDNFVS